MASPKPKGESWWTVTLRFNNYGSGMSSGASQADGVFPADTGRD